MGVLNYSNCLSLTANGVKDNLLAVRAILITHKNGQGNIDCLKNLKNEFEKGIAILKITYS